MRRKPSVNLPGAVVPSDRVIPGVMDWPSTRMSLVPWITNMVPSVASMSGILRTTISRAFSNPASAPAATTARIATVPTWL